jgi:hypothetical protein
VIPANLNSDFGYAPLESDEIWPESNKLPFYFFYFFYFYEQIRRIWPVRSLNLYSEGLPWDFSTQHFLVVSLRNRTIAAVSDVGVVKTLISDSSLPENVIVLGLAMDSANHRLLTVIHAMDPLPHFDALAAYDLRSGNRLFLSLLPSDDDTIGTRQNSAGNFDMTRESDTNTTRN